MHPTGGSLRVFRQFAWLGVDSGKVALSQPTHQRVTRAVRLHAGVFINLSRVLFVREGHILPSLPAVHVAHQVLVGHVFFSANHGGKSVVSVQWSGSFLSTGVTR